MQVDAGCAETVIDLIVNEDFALADQKSVFAYRKGAEPIIAQRMHTETQLKRLEERIVDDSRKAFIRMQHLMAEKSIELQDIQCKLHALPSQPVGEENGVFSACRQVDQQALYIEVINSALVSSAMTELIAGALETLQFVLVHWMRSTEKNVVRYLDIDGKSVAEASLTGVQLEEEVWCLLGNAVLMLYCGWNFALDGILHTRQQRTTFWSDVLFGVSSFNTVPECERLALTNRVKLAGLISTKIFVNVFAKTQITDVSPRLFRPYLFDLIMTGAARMQQIMTFDKRLVECFSRSVNQLSHSCVGLLIIHGVANTETQINLSSLAATVLMCILQSTKRAYDGSGNELVRALIVALANTDTIISVSALSIDSAISKAFGNTAMHQDVANSPKRRKIAI